MEIRLPIFFLVVITSLTPAFVNGRSWPKIKEIFDFSLGSVFHYSTVVSGCETSEQTATTYLITSRTDITDVKRDTISVHYTVLVHLKYENSITSYSNYETTFLTDWYYDHLDDSISLAKNIQFNGHDYVADSIGCARFATCSEWGSCLDDKTRSQIFEKKQWAKGLGLIAHNYSESSMSDQFNSYTRLVYYKKSGQIGCGTPLSNAKGLTGAYNNSVLNIYPNYSADILNVVFNNGYITGYSLNIIDLSGQLVIINELRLRFNSIDISALEKGIYYLKVNDSNANVVAAQKLVKE